MSVKYIFLALLDTAPIHGYEIKEAFEKLVFHQWPLNYGQVYTTLSRLERDNLVYHEEIEQEEKPDKKVYHITEAGRKALKEWLFSSANHNIYFDDMAFKVILFDIISTKNALEILQQYKKYLFAVMKNLIQLREEMKDAPLGKQFIIERNILKTESDLKWVAMCQENSLRS